MKTKRVLSLVLIGLISNVFFLQGTVSAKSKEEEFAAKVKSGVAKLGAGKESLVRVKLKDKSKVVGYIGDISEDSFTVVNQTSSSVTKIEYQQVKQVRGNNLSKNVKIAIGVIIIVAIVAVAIAVAFP